MDRPHPYDKVFSSEIISTATAWVFIFIIRRYNT
ncbi:hypothetical protein OIU77_015605 [Salix suchowensis]|uniref:Uncharacterized protein n=1 Tax=Salix suchowensis TaxID=1278906 RepID=A0ABQ8ZHL0_9ROSI|nr:hypothetical protein OIU77_015605 [Salix suchowensis]